MRDSDRLGLAVMLAAALALTALAPLTEDERLFTDCLVMIAVIGLAGILARRMTGDGVAARLLQVLSGLVALLVLAAASGVAGPAALPALVQDALRWTVQSAAPMGPNTGVRLVAVMAVGLLAFLADQLAVSYGHPAWTLMPLGVPYLVSALALPALVDFTSLLWLAVGYLGVLLAEAANRHRTLRRLAGGGPRWSLPLGGVTMLLSGVLAAGLAGVFLPGLDAGRGAPFRGQGPIEMGDPSLDLRRNLQLPVDVPVLDYRTSTGRGAYLRLTALPGFDATGFHLDPIDLFEGNLPTPPGTTGSERYSIAVTVGDFNAEWLPLPYAPASFTAAGQWRHDPQSLSVLAAGPNQKRATNALRYEATVIDTTPTAERLRAASAGYPSDGSATAAVPDDLPPRIRELAEAITADARTDGEKAVLIQQWLRSSRFSYSTEPAPGSGYQALTRFLFEDRRGYCEQFATSMAALARTVGIPARVAVGFLPGERVDDGFEVSIRDMHAWPELYFGGLGWVAFEPTPGVAAPPTYTVRGAEATPTPSPSATPTPSVETEQPSAEPSQPADEPEPEQVEEADLSWLGWTAGGVALVIAVVCAPALLRRWRRTRRLELRQPRQAVHAAWDEVRDSVWDAGAQWPRGSARQIGERVAGDLTGEAASAMGRVAVLVERARYAESVGEIGDLSGDVEQIRAGIEAARRPAWWRRLFPRSLWRGLWWRG